MTDQVERTAYVTVPQQPAGQEQRPPYVYIVRGASSAAFLPGYGIFQYQLLVLQSIGVGIRLFNTLPISIGRVDPKLPGQIEIEILNIPPQ